MIVRELDWWGKTEREFFLDVYDSIKNKKTLESWCQSQGIDLKEIFKKEVVLARR